MGHSALAMEVLADIQAECSYYKEYGLEPCAVAMSDATFRFVVNALFPGEYSPSYRFICPQIMGLSVITDEDLAPGDVMVVVA